MFRYRFGVLLVALFFFLLAAPAFAEAEVPFLLRRTISTVAFVALLASALYSTDMSRRQKLVARCLAAHTVQDLADIEQLEAHEDEETKDTGEKNS